MSDASEDRLVLELCDDALLLTGAARAQFLASACRGNPGRRAAVEAVLQAIEDSGTFLQPEKLQQPSGDDDGGDP